MQNSKMTTNESKIEKVILVGVITGTEDIDKSLDELEELVSTAGAVTVGRLVQSRDRIHPGTYLGKGKIEELMKFIDIWDATGIVADDELSPAQMKNLEDILNIKVMDRTMVILDIFATRATSSEGKIQVELAQLRYSLTRLAGHGTAMSRLGGGIGTRGPGETKLETDKRVIRNRISFLKSELNNIINHREVTRGKRTRNNLPVAAIVGYTNAGKSTLLNTLTDARVLSEDKLFATLDPTTRSLELESGTSILLTDTVGFINKLPHHLIEAFKSTLEEARYADIIIHVVDSSNPYRDVQMSVVYNTLNDLGIIGKPIITLFNKCDLEDTDPIHHDEYASQVINASAVTGEGLESLKTVLIDTLRQNKELINVTIPYSEAGIIQRIREKGELINEEYTENGITVLAYVPDELAYLKNLQKLP